ncbi:MAG: chitosanase [Cocleimonas sp.]|nr:chitosanase [Cocleimonas sp.]
MNIVKVIPLRLNKKLLKVTLLTLASTFVLFTASAETAKEGKLDFNNEQRLIADQFISIFENGSTDIEYKYAKDINDGRGITAGRAGFTSATGDMLSLLKKYTKSYPNNTLATYLNELERLQQIYADNDYTSKGCNGCGYTGNLVGLKDRWVENATLPEFIKAQDDYVDEHYFNAALKKANALGLKYPLSLLSLYDSNIMHGGSGLDELSAKATKVTKKGSPKQGADEIEWLKNFNIIRKKVLKDAGGPWAEALTRVTELEDLIAEKNTQLVPFLMVIQAYGNEKHNLPVGSSVSKDTKDTIEPSTPTFVTATQITKNSLFLSWKNSTDNVGVTGYEVFANGKKVETVAANTHRVQLKHLTPNVNYSLKVRAVDAAGNSSEFSDPETAVTDADTSTTTPVLVANAGSDKILRCGDSYRTLGQDNSNKPTTDGASYRWAPSSHITGSTVSKTVRGTKPGTYTLTVSKTGSDTVTDTVIITKEKGCATTPVVKVSLNYKASTGGTITGETNQTINKGATGKKVTAVANDGYHFTSWSDDLKEAARVDYKVSKNTTLTASFEKDAVVVTPPADTAPEATTLIGPTGSTIDTTPTYTWKSVSNTKWYYLWTLDNTDKRTGKWYKASELGCENGGTCSITPSTERALGTVRWHVISWNKTGFSPWSKANYFKVTSPENPAEMTPEDPIDLRNKSLELPKGPEVVTELADGESSGGSFPLAFLMLGLIGLMRRK